MTLSFKYKTVKRPDGTEVKTPSIPVLLSNKQKFETIALIDSGADISAIPRALAEILDLDINGEHHYAYGLGGKVACTQTTMEITIEKGHEKYSFRIPVKVILENYDFPVLLGRSGFFDKFIISFDQKNERVLLKRIINSL